MAVVNGPNFDHIDLQQSGTNDVTRHKLQDSAGRSFVAPTEASSTASAAHAAGTYFLYNGSLYRATADIASGGTITPGTNCAAVTGGIGAQVAQNTARIEELISQTGIKENATSKFRFTDGYAVYYSSGEKASSSVLAYSNYVAVPDWCNKIVFMGVVRPSNINTGCAFYTAASESAFITGSGKKNKVDESLSGYAAEETSVNVPDGAKYFRTNWLATTNAAYSSYTFSAYFVNDGLISDAIADLEADMQELQNRADNVGALDEEIRWGHCLTDYKYAENIELIEDPTATNGTQIGIKRELMTFTVNGTVRGDYAEFIKISGYMQRTSYSSNAIDGWPGAFTPENGHKYRVCLIYLSGTYTLGTEAVASASVSVYKQGTHASLGTYYYEGENFYREFASDGSPVNLVMYIAKGNAMTNMKYLVVLEDLTKKEAAEKAMLSKYGLSEDVKSYYAAEMTDTIAKVRASITEPAIVIPIITDEHRYDSPVQNWTEMINNVRALSKIVKCDAFANTGDMIEGDKGKATSKSYAYNCGEDIMTVGLPYYFISGNHDPNPYYQNKAYMFTPAEMFAYFYAGTKKVVFNMGEDGTEYYVDFPDLGVRMVFLNSSVASNDSIYSFGENSGAWLANTALDTEYNVLLFVHVSPYTTQVVGNTSIGNSSSVRTAISNFISGGGNLIMISGHSHRDMAFHSPHLSVMNGCQKFENAENPTAVPSGITGYIDEIIKPVREDETATKDLWTVMVYKPYSRDIDFVRFGAGYDRYFHAAPIGAETVTSRLTGTLSWESSDDTVATVSGGTITKVGAGRCAVWAKEATTGNYECWIVEFSE